MAELINGRTPDEIKKGLQCCFTPHSCYGECPYYCDKGDISDCTTELANDALAYIQYLEAQRPKWISVKERLPVKQYRVIVRTGHNLVTTGWRSYHVDVKGGELWEVDEAHNYRNDVTHWMSLPNLPEEDM